MFDHKMKCLVYEFERYTSITDNYFFLIKLPGFMYHLKQTAYKTSHSLQIKTESLKLF